MGLNIAGLFLAVLETLVDQLVISSSRNQQIGFTERPYFFYPICEESHVARVVGFGTV